MELARNSPLFTHETPVPFTAVCQHCRASKFRVPSKKRGTFMTCPKCDLEFMLVPNVGVDVPLMEYKELPFEDDEPTGEAEPLEVKAEETAATVPQSFDTAETPAARQTVVISTPPPPEAGNAPDFAFRLALVALGFFGAGMVASQFPYGRFIAAPIVGLGFLLGGLALLGLDKKQWLGWAAAGLNVLGLLLVLLLPSWLGISGWTPVGDPERAPKPVTAVGRDGSLPKTVEWVDASQAVWEQGDVRITVVGVAVGSADPMSKNPDKRKERVLRLTLKLTNVGVARAIEFVNWSPAPETETKLSAATTGALTQKATTAEKAVIYPGKSAENVLTFAAPDKPEDLRLEIPAQALGAADPARILIPKSMIAGR